MIARILILFTLLFATPVMAQDDSPTAAAMQALDQATSQFQSTDDAFDKRTTPAERQALQDRATAVKQTASAQVSLLQSQLALIDARIAQLGAPTPGVVEAPDIRAQRKLMTQQRSAVDSAIKRGKLLGVEADQLAAEIGESRADAFSERMTAHVASPVTPVFWATLLHVLPRDGQRLTAFLGAEGAALRSSFAGRGWFMALLGIVTALLLVIPARLWLRSIGRRYVIAHVPGSRVRRSGLAVWQVAIGTALPSLAAIAIVQGLSAGGMLAASWERLAQGFQRGILLAALITALGNTLLQPKQASWRLFHMSDRVANGLRPWALATAVVVMASLMLTSLHDAMGASGPARAVVESFSALLYLALVLGILLSGARLRTLRIREAPAEEISHAGAAFVSLAAWGVLIASATALLTGYVSLAHFLARFTVWVTVVGATLYLALVAVDDICSSLFRQDGRLSEAFHQGFGLRRSLIDQFGVALSAIVRLGLMTVAAGLVFAPFGSNLTTLIGQLGRIAQGVTIGQITVSPGAILRAAAVLVVGLFIVRAVQHWLTHRFLPATELDAGARNSVSMVARYTGLILAVLWSLASLGIGVERIALLLSALSVGIGFGLQAITQNFVSGLILLAERPVKIGDLVRIGDQEGDVKRISVRATEIQIADRSTLIVPNSELITKTIRNMTLADPIGRIKLGFSVPLGTDMARLKEMVLQIYADVHAVLDEPAASLYIDSIANDRVNVMSFAYVHSPREVYGTRSAILFHLLERLPAAGIDLGTSPQQFQFVGIPDPGADKGAAGA